MKFNVQKANNPNDGGQTIHPPRRSNARQPGPKPRRLSTNRVIYELSLANDFDAKPPFASLLLRRRKIHMFNVLENIAPINETAKKVPVFHSNQHN